MLNTLPTPDLIAKAHSERLYQHICATIDKQGALDFAAYMQLALYAPGLGYYSAGARKFGPGGDFVTAPELSPLFSQCLARQFQQIQSDIGGSILELGAGSGIMAVDILKYLETQQQLPEFYYILEVSADLRDRQQALFKEKAPHLLAQVQWLDQLPTAFSGIIIANEVIDAMPVHKFIQQQGIQEFFVEHHEKQLCWKIAEPQSPLLKQKIAALGIEFGENYESEINLWLDPWIASLAEVLQQGLMLFIDYGFPRHEYYHPSRETGTIMCHYQHRSHPDPLIWPGIQDITAHVDFTAIAEAADAHHLNVAGFTTQAAFLLNVGLLELIPEDLNEADRYKVNQQIKKLTLPSEMGELFKAMALTKNYDQPLLGFKAMNQLERL